MAVIRSKYFGGRMWQKRSIFTGISNHEDHDEIEEHEISPLEKGKNVVTFDLSVACVVKDAGLDTIAPHRGGTRQ
jgi:hypothetical protein